MRVHTQENVTGVTVIYKRYTVGEVKSKIIDVLQNNRSGLSGIEIAYRTGINRMTVTKYLSIFSALGLIEKKRIGPVNIWYLGNGVTDIEFPINYLEIQQKFIDAVTYNDENQARKIIVSILNSNAEQMKILIDILLPTINTLNELYNRGKLGKTELLSMLNIIIELTDLVKFNVQQIRSKPHAYSISIAGSEDQIYLAKIGTVALHILGWNSSYIGNIEQHIDPFFDIDLQRYITRLYNDKKGIMIVCIYTSKESSLRFISTAIKTMKKKLKGQIYIIALASAELANLSNTLEVDYVAADLQSLIDWTKKTNQF